MIETEVFGAHTSPRYKEYASDIHASGEHLLALINDVLDLSKIEAGKWTLTETACDLRHITQDCIQLLLIKAQQANVQLLVEMGAHLPLIYADERALRQILVNLLSNAIKFTPPNGKVTAFAGTAGEGQIVFGVADTGMGIAPDDLQRVFESFRQGRHEALQADQSTGLGLPIVKGLAETHGGTVTLESVLQEGTRVTVILPKERARPAASADTAIKDAVHEAA